MPASNDADLKDISHFAGRHLAVASRIVLNDGFLQPSGMTLTHSFWSGAKEEIVALRTNDPKLVLEMAERWFMSDHKAKFVSAAIDSYSTINGIRTAAVIISARPRDFSRRMLVFLPYTPKTENSPTVLAAPLVDFPAEYAALQPQRDYALEHVLRGRDGHPLSKPRVP